MKKKMVLPLWIVAAFSSIVYTIYKIIRTTISFNAYMDSWVGNEFSLSEFIDWYSYSFVLVILCVGILILSIEAFSKEQKPIAKVLSGVVLILSFLVNIVDTIIMIVRNIGYLIDWFDWQQLLYIIYDFLYLGLAFIFVIFIAILCFDAKAKTKIGHFFSMIWFIPPILYVFNELFYYVTEIIFYAEYYTISDYFSLFISISSTFIIYMTLLWTLANMHKRYYVAPPKKVKKPVVATPVKPVAPQPVYYGQPTMRLEDNETEPQKNSVDEIASSLKTYKDLLDNGIITQEEYDIKKKEILGI